MPLNGLCARIVCVRVSGWWKQTNEVMKKKKKLTSGEHDRKKIMYIVCARVTRIVERTKATIKRTHQASIERIETGIT